MLPDLGLIGPAQSGKDSVARVLVEDYGYTRVAFADALREVALAANPVIHIDRTGPYRLSETVDEFGWEAAKARPEVRRLLQDLGVAVRQYVDPQAWVRAGMAKAEVAHAGGRPCVFTDLRFLNEAHAIRVGLGGFLVRVRRPRSEALSGALASHVSETELAGYPAQYTITNDGSLDDLARAVHATIRNISILEPA